MYLNDYHNSLSALCKQYRVKKLYAFGSVLTERFGKESDVDLVVDFDKQTIDIWIIR